MVKSVPSPRQAAKPVTDVRGLALPKDRPVLKVSEAAKLLNCTSTHVTGLIEDGSLQAVNIAGAGSIRQCWRIPVESWNKFLSKNTL